MAWTRWKALSICRDGTGRDYRCGKDAAMALERFLAAARPTRCELVERDRYRRFVWVCFRADDRQINRGLVESGNAVDWEKSARAAMLS